MAAEPLPGVTSTTREFRVGAPLPSASIVGEVKGEAAPPKPKAEAEAATSAVVEDPRHIMTALVAIIRRDRQYVGLYGFLLFALAKKVHVVVWDGDSSYDLLQVFAPWAIASCTGEAQADVIIAACERDEETGEPCCYPISERHPLSRANHYVAGIRGGGDAPAGNSVIEVMYLLNGRTVVFTIGDGDCALDTMCIVGGFERSLESRRALRRELSDYLKDHLEDERLQCAFARKAISTFAEQTIRSRAVRQVGVRRRSRIPLRSATQVCCPADGFR